MANPVSLPFTYFMQDNPLLLDSKQYFFISHTIGPTDLFPSFSSTTFQNFPGVSDLLPEASQVSAPYKAVLQM